MWKMSCRAVCWTELDFVALGLSSLHSDPSMRNLDDLSTPGCKCWSMDHYFKSKKKNSQTALRCTGMGCSRTVQRANNRTRRCDRSLPQ
jgi:hypothetical protein